MKACYLLTICLFFALPFFTLPARAQVLAAEPFNYGAGTAINGESGGSGWALPWSTQNNNTSVPGYSISNNLTYPGFNASGSNIIGGILYQSSGRQFDLTSGGAFANYLSGSSIGTGDLWTAVLIEKTAGNNDEVSYSLSNTKAAWNYTQNSSIAAGYFGSANSNTGGVQYWTLAITRTSFIQTTVPVTIGTAALLAIHIQYNYPVSGTTTVSLFVNPSLNTLPVVPSAVVATTTPVPFQSMAIYGGNSPNGGAFDEIRVASTYFGAVNSVIDLPVRWLSFTATPSSKGAVRLDWSTSSEMNSGYFTVERSVDGQHFDSLGEVTAAGDNATVSNYQFPDEGAGAAGGSTLYYRVRETDKDGTVSYSVICTVQLTAAAAVRVTLYPNPVQNLLNVQISDPAEPELVLIDAGGRTVRVEKGAGSISSMDVSSLARGIYFLHIQNGGQQYTYDIMKN